MVLLNCALVGEGSVISIIIEEWKTVALLKKAIKEEKPNDFKDVDADKLQLFLAKTEGGAWLAGAGVAAVTVDGDGHPQGFELMDPTLWIKNPKHFGANFQPGEGQVHVLVVVPDGAGGSASETSASSKMIKEIHAETVLKKRTFAHS
ncbi:hypothetical protein PC119_g26966, partial [Phytophthora cactorum]